MKLNKLILLIVILLSLGLWYSFVYSADLEVESGGSLTAQTITFNEQSSLPAVQEGQIVYKGNQLLVSDGIGWNPIVGAKTIATRIVATENLADTGKASLDTTKADYVCNGTNDQVEIQDAIDDLGTNGGVVYLLEGTYNISGSIVLNAGDSNKSLIGAGAATVLKAVSGASGVNVIDASSGVTRILISRLMIDGNSQTGSNNQGISFASVTDSKINNVWVEGMADRGIALSASSNNNIISGNSMQTNADNAINLDGSSNNIISGNIMSSNGGYGISVESSSINNIISANNMRNNSNGMLNSSSSNNTISGNIIQSNTGSGLDIAAGTPVSENNTVSGNIFYDNGDVGVYINADNNIVSANIIQSNALGGIWLVSAGTPENNVISGNLIDQCSNGYSGITVSSNSSSNLFASNLITDSAGSGVEYGIDITDSTCIDNYFVGNLIHGAAYTGREINDLGTGTIYTGKEKITFEAATVVPTAGATLDPVSSPRTYIRLNPASDISLNTTTAIADGQATGDLVILENISSNTVTLIDGANVQLDIASYTLKENDIVKLIWHGTDWLEIAYSQNTP